MTVDRQVMKQILMKKEIKSFQSHKTIFEYFKFIGRCLPEKCFKNSKVNITFQLTFKLFRVS